MRLVGFGGDARMLGALAAAKRAGWETQYVCREEEDMRAADAVMLPWPQSFGEGVLAGTRIAQARAEELIPPCRVMLHGAGVSEQMLARAQAAIDPTHDEELLRVNAKLTAEGALARAMARQGRALLGSTCVVTGFGRIAQALTARLTAMEAFVIVCARNEAQMRRAHAMGAHPMPLGSLPSACAQADVVFNTAPARIFGEAALARLGEDALYIELASPPFGVDAELARRMGVQVALERGVPGRYAPMDAGAALFDALQRAMVQQGAEGGETNG